MVSNLKKKSVRSFAHFINPIDGFKSFDQIVSFKEIENKYFLKLKKLIFISTNMINKIKRTM